MCVEKNAGQIRTIDNRAIANNASATETMFKSRLLQKSSVCVCVCVCKLLQ